MFNKVFFLHLKKCSTMLSIGGGFAQHNNNSKLLPSDKLLKNLCILALYFITFPKSFPVFLVILIGL